jgi:hypothetical protein
MKITRAKKAATIIVSLVSWCVSIVIGMVWRSKGTSPHTPLTQSLFDPRKRVGLVYDLANSEISLAALIVVVACEVLGEVGVLLVVIGVEGAAPHRLVVDILLLHALAVDVVALAEDVVVGAAELPELLIVLGSLWGRRLLWLLTSSR